jgi:hypothetical protein
MGGKTGQWAVLVGDRGAVRGEAFPVAASSCATSRGFFWIERTAGQPAKLRERPWDSAVRDAAKVPSEAAPSLICGDQAVHLLWDGEDGLMSMTAAKPSPVLALRDQDFDDEEAHHHPYLVGDVLGLVRVSDAGKVAFREQRDAAKWRAVKSKLTPTDDIVAVEASGESLLVAYTRDESDACKSLVSESVHMLTVHRATGKATETRLAAAECGKDNGPFWIARPGVSPVLAWVERGRRVDATSAPIVGFAYRALAGADVASEVVHVPLAADALVEAGCEGTVCFAAALVREPAGDGMTPERVRILRFP